MSKNSQVLSKDDSAKFNDLYDIMLSYIYHKRVPISMQKKAFEKLDQEAKISLRNIFFENLSTIIDDFLQSNYIELPSDSLDIIKSWKASIKNIFMIKEYTQDYAQLCSDNGNCYAVKALVTPFASFIPHEPPFMAQTAILPFKNQIVSDGVFAVIPVEFNQNLVKKFQEETKKQSKKNGLIFSLH